MGAHTICQEKSLPSNKKDMIQTSRGMPKVGFLPEHVCKESIQVTLPPILRSKQGVHLVLLQHTPM